MLPRRSLLLTLALTLSFVRADVPPAVRVVYFLPTDAQPAPNYVARLGRVMAEVQRFYRVGLDRCGYGPLTFQTERDAAGQLRVHLVKGQRKLHEYGRNDAFKIAAEARDQLRAAGLDPSRETILYFAPLLEWRDGKAIELGPYCGLGNALSGACWQFDDERLDPARLSSREPGGYYGRPCTIGEFNSHYVGGVAHELGHAFGLPHDCEQAADKALGHSLMGGGNHTYGRELRGEQPGAFLSAVSALPLAHHPLFVGSRAGAETPATARLAEIACDVTAQEVTLTGRLVDTPAAYGIAAYNDNEAVPADYDAVGWTCPVDADGRFKLRVGELRDGRYELRLRVCHVNGAASRFAVRYRREAGQALDPSVFLVPFIFDEAIKSFAAGQREQAAAQAKTLAQRYADRPEVVRRTRHLLALTQPRPRLDLGALPATQNSAPLCCTAWREAKVGWGSPLSDRVLAEDGQLFLQLDGQFHEHGLFAHAPAQYAWLLGGRWARLRTGYGLQDGASGSVVCVIRGDGRELFRSPLVKDHQLRETTVDLRGVDRLELVVEDGGDGARSDWGVWVDPTLTR